MIHSLHSSNCQSQEIYNKIKVLGKGAFGEAVLYQKQDDSLVVWKEIDLSRLGSNRNEVDNEIDILSLLSHPNIVQYYNHFFCDDKLYIEMEYANGGSLAKKISDQNDELFPESTVLWYFYQICLATGYLHDMGIIHRDVKTLNIFLTKSDICKMGDFGMSKQMKNEQQMADTVLGTPYYMSPELIKGVSYNSKSDIWALGCILHELLTLQKTFQASNTLKLASEIIKCDFKAIDARYSNELNNMIHMCLKIEPEERADVKGLLALEFMQEKKGEIELNLLKCGEYKWGLSATKSREPTMDFLQPTTTVTSSATELYIWGGGKQFPQQQTLFDSERTTTRIAVGDSFLAVITIDNELFTWMTGISTCGSGVCGQLGHGDSAFYKSPKLVEALKGVPVKDVACGNDFTICLTESNGLYSFGSNYYGCLGVGQHVEQCLEPTQIEFFNQIDCNTVCCGDNHVLLLDKEHRLYSWGCGEFGRLGLGSEDDVFEPTLIPIKLPGSSKIVTISCGYDTSFFITDDGKVLACGSNEHNKLGFNQTINGVGPRTVSYDIQYFSTPKLVSSLMRYHVLGISAGKTHSAAIDDFGALHLFGSNEFGQLGQGHTKQINKVVQMAPTLGGKTVTKVACGDGFSVAATSENQLYSWGLGAEGRLGLDVSINSKGVACTSLPKAIFGTLYKVKAIAARGWTTAIIAERVLSQKSLTPSSSASRSSSKICSNNEKPDIIEDNEKPKAMQDPFADFSDLFNTTKSNATPIDNGEFCDNQPNNNDMESTRQIEGDLEQSSQLPDWLKDEMVQNEIIPLDTDERSPKTFDPPSKEPKGEPTLFENLQKENSQLKSKVSELEMRIQQLESRLVLCVCSSKNSSSDFTLDVCDNQEWECDV